MTAKIDSTIALIRKVGLRGFKTSDSTTEARTPDAEDIAAAPILEIARAANHAGFKASDRSGESGLDVVQAARAKAALTAAPRQTRSSDRQQATSLADKAQRPTSAAAAFDAARVAGVPGFAGAVVRCGAVT